MSVIAYKWMSLLIYQSDSRAFLPFPLFFWLLSNISLSSTFNSQCSTPNTIIFLLDLRHVIKFPPVSKTWNLRTSYLAHPPGSPRLMRSRTLRCVVAFVSFVINNLYRVFLGLVILFFLRLLGDASTFIWKWWTNRLVKLFPKIRFSFIGFITHSHHILYSTQTTGVRDALSRLSLLLLWFEIPHVFPILFNIRGGCFLFRPPPWHGLGCYSGWLSQRG